MASPKDEELVIDDTVDQPVEPISEEIQRNWLAIVALVAAGLAVAVLVVLGGRWVYHSIKGNNKVIPAPANTKKLPKPPPSNLQPGGNGSTPTTNDSNPPGAPLPTTGG